MIPLPALLAAPKPAAAAGAIVGALIVFAPAFLLGSCDGAKREREKQASASLAVVRQGTKALESAASQRIEDTATVAQLERTLTDAVKAVPDDVPSGPAIAGACFRLRAQGVDIAAIPQCAGPAGRVQASADR